MRVMLMLCAALALAVGVATATAGGNSPNAKLCQKSGWQTLYTSTGGTFASEEVCVSYAAQGGTLLTSPPKTKSQLDCEAVGGTFDHDLQAGVYGPGITLLWSCNGNGVTYAYWTSVLDPDCVADGGNARTWASIGTAGVPATSCQKQ